MCKKDGPDKTTAVLHLHCTPLNVFTKGKSGTTYMLLSNQTGGGHRSYKPQKKQSQLYHPFYLSVEENNVLYPRAFCPEVTNAAGVVQLEDSMLGIKNQDPQQEAQQEIREVYSNDREETGEMNSIQELNSSILPQEMRQAYNRHAVCQWFTLFKHEDSCSILHLEMPALQV